MSQIKTVREEGSEPVPAPSGQTVQFTPARTPGPPQPHPAPASPPTPVVPPPAPMVVKKTRGGSRRFILIVVIPLIALVAGFAWWLTGGRYITTDNSYVGADKSLITPQVTGAIVGVHVIEGQKVKAGDPLFDIDPKPYEIAAALARGRVDAAKVAFDNLKASYISNRDQIKMGQDAVNVRKSDYDRKAELMAKGSGTGVDRDTSLAALIQAQQILEFVNNQQASTITKLGGSLDAPLEKFPEYMQAKAGLDNAERDLANTKVVSPIDGVATQVPQIQLGRVAPAGQPVFAVVADKNLWVDGNPKESDMTFVREGQPATVTIDAFPGRTWNGTLCSIAPGTGAQFSILPPQNASGNWVKVVQRVPLRFCFAPGEDTSNLRSGMSAYLSIDTGRVRTLKGVLDDVAETVDGLMGRSAPSAAASVK